MTSAGPLTSDLVLVGGGHSHLPVLKAFGMRPVPGAHLTLVAPDPETPYSGMLPGLVAGHYHRDEAYVDLEPLAAFARARTIAREAVGLDLEGRRVLLRDRPPIPFDLLSLNVGSTPRTRGIEGAREHGVPAKPVDRFLAWWREIEAERISGSAKAPMRIGVLGGGAGGLELVLALAYRTAAVEGSNGPAGQGVEFHLVTASQEILPTHNRRAREKLLRALRERGVQVHEGRTVTEVGPDGVFGDGGWSLSLDRVVVVTDGAPPSWVTESGLAVDEAGFVRVDEYLRSVSHPFVFAAGDVAVMERYPRPRSGVFAVRQGPPLARNLRRTLQGRAPKPHRPQKAFLSLISTGDRYAVASRSRWALEGRWVWRLKDRIDRRWMEQWRDLPSMEEEGDMVEDSGERGASGTAPGAEEVHGPAEPLRSVEIAMRCKGCAAKVGRGPLTRVLRRLRDDLPSETALVDPDDAAVMEPMGDGLQVQTIDYFPAMVNDPWRLGRIATVHALGDLWAMGAEPRTALALATLPYGPDEKVEEALYQLLHGANRVLRAEGAALVGGHTGEGPELAFGLQATGVVQPDRILRKGGMVPGHALIFTKAVGTGVLFAAQMRGKAKGRWIEAALRSMERPSGDAATCFQSHGASACTDVTGFGLLGHLQEMAHASEMVVELDPAAVPALEGAQECWDRGFRSSLHPANVRAARTGPGGGPEEFESHPRLFDPQTAGGLLAAVPAERVSACVEGLRMLGHESAGVVGSVLEPDPDGGRVIPAQWGERPRGAVHGRTGVGGA